MKLLNKILITALFVLLLPSSVLAANTKSADFELSSSQYLSITDANLSSNFPGKSGSSATGDFSIETWAKRESTGGGTEYYQIIAKRDGDSVGFFSFNFDNNDKITFTYNNTGGTDDVIYKSDDANTSTAWQHIAVTVDVSASTVKLYVNGTEIDGTYTRQNATALGLNDADFLIGNDYRITEVPFDGLIDDVRVWNDIRTATEISDNYNKQLAGTESNLQGYWRMNNDFTDETSNGNDLTNNNSVTFSADIPMSDETNSNSTDLELSKSQYWSITDAAQTGLDITGDITIEAWVKLEQLPSTPNVSFKVVNKAGSSDNFSYFFYIANNDKLAFIYSSSGTTSGWNTIASVAGVLTSIDTWYHIAVTVDVSTKKARFFVNGIFKDEITGGGTATSIYNGNADFTIGHWNTDYYDGKIDDVRVWNDIRTSTEISDNYEKELDGDEAGLVGYWQFNGDGDDLTSNSNDLTSNNGAAFNGDVPFSGSVEAIRRMWMIISRAIMPQAIF